MHYQEFKYGNELLHFLTLCCLRSIVIEVDKTLMLSVMLSVMRKLLQRH